MTTPIPPAKTASDRHLPPAWRQKTRSTTQPKDFDRTLGPAWATAGAATRENRSEQSAADPHIIACRATRYTWVVIKSIQRKGLHRFFETGSRAGIVTAHAERLRLQLSALDTATITDDIDFRGYRLHRLVGDQTGRWSITVQANWRLTFEFLDGDAHVVDYEDYHR